jgi:hypothetical protein
LHIVGKGSLVDVGAPHSALNHGAIEIRHPGRAKEREEIPIGTLSPAAVSDLAEEGVAEFIGPIGSPISDNMSVPT